MFVELFKDVFKGIVYILSNSIIVVNYHLNTMLNEVVVAYFKLLSERLL